MKASGSPSDELLTLKLRYKQPEAAESREIRFSLVDTRGGFDEASADYRFSAAVAAFGMILRNSEWKGTASLESVADWAATALGDDPRGHRREFLSLVRRAAELRPTR